MKNIEYLEEFFRKHNLSGRVTVRYSSPEPDDEHMSEVVLENGSTIGMNDVIFDIESDFPEDVFTQWMESRKTDDTGLMEWIGTDNRYIPGNIDRSSVDAYREEMADLIDEVKKSIQSVFEFEDDGDSDEDEM